MRPSKARFITACQQLLALGVVLAVLAPAASVISLDVVREAPPGTATARPGQVGADPSAYTRDAGKKSVVPTGVVDADVREYPLTAAPGRERARVELQARTKLGAPGSTVTSEPEPVVGYGAVGVTWDPNARVAAEEVSFEVRTRTGDTWSDWLALAYDADHGPEPDSDEGRRARPGTDVLLVGKVDQVQARSVSLTDAPPADMRLAVIDPGQAASTTRETAALDTGKESGGKSGEVAPQDEPADGIELRAATYTRKPVIYSRRQWGANESLRDKSSLQYSEVHAGFVHHTVNANGYSRSEVPGILRSIYAYHTQSRGWSDVGYNFLVDRFGRIWEGRAGGIDRPVVGAHTLGYNDNAFAMSAIGNFETNRPGSAMLQAYGSLFAWKLSLHGVNAGSSRQRVGSRIFKAVNGHRDAGSTACPGRYLYAKLSVIRSRARDAQRGWAGRELESDLASTAHPDLIVRRASDGKAMVIPTGGLTDFKRGPTLDRIWAGADKVVASPDLTGDGIGDLVVRRTNGVTSVRPGTRSGFGDPVKATSAFAGRGLITAVGDLNEDGDNDLVARNTETGRLNAYLGGGGGGFTRKPVAGDWSGYDRLAATGDLDRDGHVDLLARDRDGRLWLHPGTGTRTFGAAVKLGGSWGRYDTISGFGDFTRDRRPDLVVRTKGGSGYVLPSRRNGTFGHRLGPVAQLEGVSAISGGGNLTGGRAPDVVARRGDDLLTFRNRGTFDLGRPIPTGVNLSASNAILKAGDWDRDGFGDVITRTAGNGRLQLRRGDGRGSLRPATRLATGFKGVRLLAAAGDMTGDGWPDLMGQPAGGSMRIYPGKGVKGLRASYIAHSRIDAGRQVPIGRWDADGAPDSLLRKGDRMTLFPGNGPGGLTSPKAMSVNLNPYDWVIGISDVALGGHADLIVRAKSSGYLFVLRATRDGFKPRRFLGEGMEVYDLVG